MQNASPPATIFLKITHSKLPQNHHIHSIINCNTFILRRESINDPNVNAFILKEGERESECSRILPGQKPHVSKNGSIFYKVDGGKIIDAGRSLKLVYEKSETALWEFMDLAKIKFGTMSALVVQGSEEFKNRVGELSRSMKLGLKIEQKAIVNDKDRTNERNRSEKSGMAL